MTRRTDGATVWATPYSNSSSSRVRNSIGPVWPTSHRSGPADRPATRRAAAPDGSTRLVGVARPRTARPLPGRLCGVDQPAPPLGVERRQVVLDDRVPAAPVG